MSLSIDQVMNVRPLSEYKSRGQWRTDQSVQRYERNRPSGSRLFGAARRTRESIETFAPLAEGGHAGNQPKHCLHWRL